MKRRNTLISIGIVFFYVMGFVLAFFFEFAIEDFLLKKNPNPLIEFLSLNKEQLFFKIFMNNLYVVIINVIGFISFGVLTLLNTFYNGFVLGFVIKTVVKVSSLSFILKHLLPHSFEIIGILISSFIGVYLGIKLFSFCFIENKEPIKIKTISNLLFLSILIIFISAFLETYVSIE
jgi:hypothetical protein bfra3_00215